MVVCDCPFCRKWISERAIFSVEKMTIKTEDQVRDAAKIILGFDDGEEDVNQGTGQITTFNQLGFNGVIDKPDGWYLPKDKSRPAIILETKAEKEDLFKQKWVNELLKNTEIVAQKYKSTIGVLYNGVDVRVFRNREELVDVAKDLQHKSYYIALCTNTSIDKQAIFTLTKRINDSLHIRFGIKNLYHRMIFTACALVAVKEGAVLAKGMDFNLFHQAILNQINKSLKTSMSRNGKLKLLGDIYAKIEMNSPDNQTAIDDFIGWVEKISSYVTSDNWRGEDVMGIFFNEFNRYKTKSENGQILTPDHITSFMYRLIHCNKDDRILDATCGSGAFLVKSMCNMIKEAGGVRAKKAEKIKQEQLFGIEWDKEIYALACANMLIHKDGKTNIEQLDTREQEACDWIKSKNITKVLMNPPYERKYGCMKIVQNVLDNVPIRTECAFILPDKKLEKDFTDKTFGNKVLKNHSLKKIVKLPENLFFGVGVTTSIFVFESGVPHDGKTIQGFYIEDDGLETVKNQGRQDIKNRWQDIEDKWIKIIEDSICSEAKSEITHIQSIDPSKHLSYQMPENSFEIFEEDFVKTIMDYEMFKRGIDIKKFGDLLLHKTLYGSEVEHTEDGINVIIKIKNNNE